MRRQKLAISIVVVALAGVLAAGGYWLRRHRMNAASLVSLAGQERSYADGRSAKIMIGGNANDRISVVVVGHQGTMNADRRVPASGPASSANDRIEGLRSSARVISHYPPDPEVSGLWVDGRKRLVGDRMLVIYFSDNVPATDVMISEQEQDSFVNDARTLDPLLFIEKWLTPRLPAAG